MERSLHNQHQPICESGPSCHDTHLRGELRDPVICTRSVNDMIVERIFGLHVSAKGNLIERKAALAVAGTERAHAIDDEAVVLDRRLEALLAIPYRKVSARHTRTHIPTRTYKSC